MDASPHPSKCLKVVLIIVNVVFLLLGAALCGLSVWLLVDKTAVVGTLSVTQPALIAAIAIGGFIALISLLGCCGAAASNQCALCSYATILIILILAEAAVAIAIFVLPTTINDYVRCQWYPNCGNHSLVYCPSPDYWTIGCIPDGLVGVLQSTIGPNWATVVGCAGNATYENCLAPVQDFFRSKIAIIGGVAAGFAAIEILGVVGSCVLRSQINKYRLDKGPDDDMYR